MLDSTTMYDNEVYKLNVIKLQLISYKRYLECTLVQWRLYKLYNMEFISASISNRNSSLGQKYMF